MPANPVPACYKITLNPPERVGLLVISGTTEEDLTHGTYAPTKFLVLGTTSYDLPVPLYAWHNNVAGHDLGYPYQWVQDLSGRRWEIYVPIGHCITTNDKLKEIQIRVDATGPGGFLDDTIKFDLYRVDEGRACAEATATSQISLADAYEKAREMARQQAVNTLQQRAFFDHAYVSLEDNTITWTCADSSTRSAVYRVATRNRPETLVSLREHMRAYLSELNWMC
jgi:hypothetical protein